MQFKEKKLFIAVLFVLCSPIFAQDSSRWMKFSIDGQTKIIRNPLQNSNESGKTLRFDYETMPVSPLLRMIRKNFPETATQASRALDILDIGKTTIFLEQLQIEADNLQKIATGTLATEPESLF